jgi:hypothetical protein
MLNGMDSLHATIEEFAAEGFTHVECYCPRCSMQAKADQLASPNLDGTYHRASFSAAALCGVRWAGSR